MASQTDTSHYYQLNADGSVESAYGASLKEAREKGLFASATMALKMVANPGLDIWIRNNLLETVINNPRGPMESEEQYKERIQNLAETKRTEAADFGSRLHNALENYPLHCNDPLVADHYKACLPWLKANVSFVKGNEVMLAHKPMGFAGKTDMVYQDHAGVAWIVDFKGLAVDTPIPTPTGWTSMGELRVGDTIFGADGKPCCVTAKSSVFNRKCYKITFDDKTSIVSDHVHLWSVNTWDKPADKVMSTEQIYVAHTARKAKGKQGNLRIRNALPLETEEASLPIDPYLLGFWIGDGCSRDGRITIGKTKAGLKAWLLGGGYSFKVYAKDDIETLTISGLKKALSSLGLLGGKQVPLAYLRASKEQRLALLRGLMDSDGSWNTLRKQACFVSSQRHIRDAVVELVNSLGWKASTHYHTVKVNGVECEAYTTAFAPFGMNPFLTNSRNAPQAQARIEGSNRCRLRNIHSIESVDSVPTQCIQVDSSDHLYLAGKQMVPTHNTTGFKKTKTGKWAKPTFYQSWVRQLSFYAVCWQLKHGGELPRVVSLAINSGEPCEPVARIWTPEEQEQGFREFVCAAFLLSCEKDHWPSGPWTVGMMCASIPLGASYPVKHENAIVVEATITE